jgi:hypothetical protein
LIASDHEWEQIKIAVEELENALEPPTNTEGFWQRKWEALLLCHSALDLSHTFQTFGRIVHSIRRSFENVARVVRLSKYFEDPWFRRLILTSASVFAATHGFEFITGVTYGTYYGIDALVHLFSGDLVGSAASAGASLFWLGVAIPGLYDFLCHAGQGALFIRPIRETGSALREASVYVGSQLARSLGIPWVVGALWSNQTARERLLAAFSSQNAQATIDFTLTTEELLEVVHRTPDGKPVLRLRFAPGENHNLELVSAKIDQKKFLAHDFSILKESLLPYGWNVKGVFRQIHRLLTKHRDDLIEQEKTFVKSTEIEADGFLRIDFRPHAVWVSGQRKLRYRWMNPVNVLRDCKTWLSTLQ